jgi:predicted RNase H-like nuclease (RuvC/YqgF family)
MSKLTVASLSATVAALQHEVSQLRAELEVLKGPAPKTMQQRSKIAVSNAIAWLNEHTPKKFYTLEDLKRAHKALNVSEH